VVVVKLKFEFIMSMNFTREREKEKTILQPQQTIFDLTSLNFVLLFNLLLFEPFILLNSFNLFFLNSLYAAALFSSNSSSESPGSP